MVNLVNASFVEVYITHKSWRIKITPSKCHYNFVSRTPHNFSVIVQFMFKASHLVQSLFDRLFTRVVSAQAWALRPRIGSTREAPSIVYASGLI